MMAPDIYRARKAWGIAIEDRTLFPCNPISCVGVECERKLFFRKSIHYDLFGSTMNYQFNVKHSNAVRITDYPWTVWQIT